VQQPTQYGGRFKALLVYLNAYQLLPLRRIAELTHDWFGLSNNGRVWLFRKFGGGALRWMQHS
jgi:hypothetical protein